MLDHFSNLQLALLWIAVGIGVVMPLVILLFLDFKNPSKAYREAALAQYLLWALIFVLWRCFEADWISSMEAGLCGLLAYTVGLALICDRNRRRKVGELESRLAELQKMAEKSC